VAKIVLQYVDIKVSASLYLMESCVPATIVPLNALVCLVGPFSGLESKVKVSILQWISLVLDFVEPVEKVHNMYGFFFEQLSYHDLKSVVSGILYRLTRRCDVKPFRVSRLRFLLQRDGNDAALLQLQSLYKEYSLETSINYSKSPHLKPEVFQCPNMKLYDVICKIQSAKVIDNPEKEDNEIEEQERNLLNKAGDEEQNEEMIRSDTNQFTDLNNLKFWEQRLVVNIWKRKRESLKPDEERESFLNDEALPQAKRLKLTPKHPQDGASKVHNVIPSPITTPSRLRTDRAWEDRSTLSIKQINSWKEFVDNFHNIQFPNQIGSTFGNLYLQHLLRINCEVRIYLPNIIEYLFLLMSSE